MKKSISYSKGLSGLVVTSLLLLLTIVMFGIFQSWYINFSNDMIDNEEVLPSQVRIEKLEGNILYVKNLANYDLNITEIKIAGASCSVTGIVTNNNLTLLDLGGCTDSFWGRFKGSSTNI